jgi:hypothetical protein
MTPRISATPTSAALRADTRAAGRLEEAARSWVEVGSEVPTSPSYWPVPKPADAEIVGAGLEWTVSMISELSMRCR